MSKVFLLTGLSGAGKTTLAQAMRERLGNKACAVLDGDEMRKGLCKDLGFSRADREENIRRCGELAKVLSDQGLVVLMAMIAPYAKLREVLKNIVGEDRLHIIYVDCPLETCMQRDPKKNYKKVRDGALKNYTGIDDAYEAPEFPDLVVHTSCETASESLEKIADYIGKVMDCQ